MKSVRANAVSIRQRLHEAPGHADRFLWSREAGVRFDDLLTGTCLAGRRADLAGRSVLIRTHEQLAAGLALIELDGVARRVVLCPPDLSPAHIPSIIAKAEVDAVVSDIDSPERECLQVPLRVTCSSSIAPAHAPVAEDRATEWVMLTSGTTGVPKMIAHGLSRLTAAITASRASEPGVVWSTFYDIRRYGGLQVFLRGVLGRGSLVLAGAYESPEDFLIRLAAHGVTHISGTPTHWRRALMTPAARAIAPRYVRLSGEIADQAIINALSSFYPQAAVGHAFASTEAGVAFEVNDGLEGFPASFIGTRGEVEIKIEDDSLRIRSNRTGLGYVGESALAVADEDGFVDTGDIIEQRGDRCYFLGRRSGVINIGGLKVCPEEVEAAINHHPAVRMSMVQSTTNPITGSLVVANVVLRETTAAGADVKREIFEICRGRLATHKVPATIRFVPAFYVGPAGKLARNHA